MSIGVAKKHKITDNNSITKKHTTRITRMTTSETTRNNKILNLYLAGLTLREIGEKHGITRERVRQLVAQHGGDEAKHAHKIAKRTLRNERIRNAVQTAIQTGGDPAKIAKKTGAPVTDVVSAVWNEQPQHAKRGKGQGKKKYSDEYLFQCLQKAQQINNGYASTDRYNEIADRCGFPPSVTLIARFKLWSRACTLAGVESRSKRPHVTGWGDQSYSDDEVYESLRKAVRFSGGSLPTIMSYEAARGVYKSMVSVGTIRNRVGWKNALVFMDSLIKQGDAD